MSSDENGIVVIGGGCIGLATAWQLAEQGASVTLLEAGPILGRPGNVAPRGQASWASAGMLAPLAETSSHSPLLALGAASLELYPAFMRDLSAASGVEIGLQKPGILRLALNAEEGASLSGHFTWQQKIGLPLEWIEQKDVRRIEPALAEDVGPGLLSPEEHFVGPRDLLRSLGRACSRRGVRLFDHRPATGFQATADRVTSVQTPGGDVPCDQVVLACGTWNGQLAARLGVNLEIKPIRGQIVALQSRQALSHTIYTHDGYLVPWPSGRTLVGSTQDDSGFDSKPTVEGVQKLLAFAARVVPMLASAHVQTAWAGLRPGSPDNLPILGCAPGWENVHLAAGHFRNGVLLTPITAKLMAAWILNRTDDPLFAGVEPGRFSA